MVETTAQEYRKLRKSLSQWIENPRNSTQRLTTAQANLRAALATKDPNVFRGKACEVTSDVSVLERRFGAQGVLEGVPNSWARLHASPRLQAMEFSISTLTGFLPEVAALTLSHLYCIGDTLLADRLGRVMFNDFSEHHRTKRKSTYTYDRYASLALYFWALGNRDAAAADRIRPTIKHRVFRPFITSWKTADFESGYRDSLLETDMWVFVVDVMFLIGRRVAYAIR